MPRRRATIAPTSWPTLGSTRFARIRNRAQVYAAATASKLHRQNHHLHSVQMQSSLQGQRGLIVQQSRHPVFVAEYELAGKEHAIRIFALNLLGELDQLIDPVGSQ